MMNICSYMPSSQIQVTYQLLCVLVCVCVCICKPVLVLPCMSPHPCSFPLSSSIHLHVYCLTSLFQYSLFDSITFTFFLFSFSFFPPSLSFSVMMSHFLPFITFPHPLLFFFFFLFCLLFHTLSCTYNTYFANILSSPSINPSSILPSPLLDVWPGGVADTYFPGLWGAAGVCNDHGKTYALYAITVFRRNQDGSEDCWKTYRRYSDFHDFHMRITEQVNVKLNNLTVKKVKSCLKEHSGNA